MSDKPLELSVGEPEQLTEAGRRRREEILAGLHGQLRRRVVRRRFVRSACVVMAFAGAAVAGIVVLRQNAPAEPGRELVVDAPMPTKLERPQQAGGSRVVAGGPRKEDVTVQIVSSVSLAPIDCADATPRTSIRVCMLTDDQLLEELAAAGEPCGLMRAGGKVRLVCDDVGNRR